MSLCWYWSLIGDFEVDFSNSLLSAIITMLWFNIWSWWDWSVDFMLLMPQMLNLVLMLLNIYHYPDVFFVFCFCVVIIFWRLLQETILKTSNSKNKKVPVDPYLKGLHLNDSTFYLLPLVLPLLAYSFGLKYVTWYACFLIFSLQPFLKIKANGIWFVVIVHVSLESLLWASHKKLHDSRNLKAGQNILNYISNFYKARCHWLFKCGFPCTLFCICQRVHTCHTSCPLYYSAADACSAPRECAPPSCYSLTFIFWSAPALSLAAPAPAFSSPYCHHYI